MQYFWEVRYRSPLADTRGVDVVIIETSTSDPLRAEAVAKYWLANARPSPSTLLISIRRQVVQTEDDMVKGLVTSQLAAHGADAPQSTKVAPVSPERSSGRAQA